ncbi:glycosyltransferase family 39 protein [bacterium]|nr:glycosyltransferase family 39 protein [bacterium]
MPISAKQATLNQDRLWLLLIFSLAVTARLAFLHWGHLDELVYMKYLNLARYMFSDEWWQRGYVFFSSPGYQLFIVLCERILGLTPEGIRIVQCLIGAIHCVLLAMIVRKLAPTSVAVLSGCLAAVYGPFILHEIMLNTTALDFLVNALALLFWLKALERGNAWSFYAGAGVCLGLAATLRPNALIMVVMGGVGWLLIPTIRRQWRPRIGGLITLVSGILVVLFPITLLNRITGGEWVLITASSGNLLYSGNSYYANGLTYSPPEMMLFLQNKYAIEMKNNLPVEHLMFIEAARMVTGKQLSAKESNKFWTQETLNFVRHFPVRTLKLLSRKAYYFWNAYSSHDISEIQLHQMVIKKWPFLRHAVLVPFALAGIVFLVWSGQWVRWFWFLVPIVAYWASTVMVFAVDRYRLPAYPFIIALAAWSIMTGYRYLKERRLRLGLLFILFVIIGYCATTFETEAITYSRTIASTLFELEHRGVTALRQGNYGEAERMFRKMVDLDSGSGQLAHENLAVIAEIRGDVALAERERLLAKGYGQPGRDRVFYEKQLTMNRNNVEAYVTLGTIAWQEHKKKEALHYFEQAINVAPWWPAAHYNCGIALLYDDPSDPRAALKALNLSYEIGLKFSPLAADVLYHMGRAYYLMNDQQNARLKFRAALERDQNHERARAMLRQLNR